jgi:L-rhamnose isomerase
LPYVQSPEHRKSQIPPAQFWAAAADHVAPADQAALGDAAHARGLYRDAAQLHKNAAAAGNLRAASYLSGHPPCLLDDARPVRWAVAHAVLDDPDSTGELLRKLQATDALDQVTVLASRAAAHVSLGDPGGVALLLRILREADAQDHVTAILPPASPSTTRAA